MDGNGRWAKQRGLPRTEGHKRGEAALFDVVEGAIEIGITHLSAYAFSTENWKRSPDEVRWLMGFNRDVIRRRRDQLHRAGGTGALGRAAGRAVAQRDQRAGDRRGDVPRQPRADLAVLRQLRRPSRDRRRGRGDRRARWRPAGSSPDRVTEKMFARYLYAPDVPDVDLFLRSSGEQRTSNFLSGSRRTPSMSRSTPLAGLRPPPPVVRLRAVRAARPAVRRRGPHPVPPEAQTRP